MEGDTKLNSKIKSIKSYCASAQKGQVVMNNVCFGVIDYGTYPVNGMFLKNRFDSSEL